MNVSEDTSQKIKNMSLVCALLVVSIHVPWPHNHFSFTWLIYHLVADGIARMAVPFFFVISGFFLSKHMNDHNWYGSEIKKRIYSLIIPFVIWNIIAIILVTPLSIIADFLAHRPLGDSSGLLNGQWIKTLGLDFRYDPLRNGSLWYLRCLFFFVLLAPVFKWLVLKVRFVWLAFALGLTLLHASWSFSIPFLQDFFMFGISLSGVFYFSFGIYLGRSKTKNPTQLYFAFCSIVSLTLLFAKSLLSFLCIDPQISLITIAIPFIMYSIWYLTPKSKWSPTLTSCSFPVFLMHQPILHYLTLAIKYSPLNCSLIGSLLLFLGASLTSLGLTISIRKFCPRLNTFLFAGRS